MHETGLFISGGAETTRTVDRPGPARVLRPPGPVGGDGGRSRAGARRRSRSSSAGSRRSTTCSARRRSTPRSAARPIAAGDRLVAALPVGQPRRGRLRRPVHASTSTRAPEPAPRVRVRHPLLPRARRWPGSSSRCSSPSSPAASPTSRVVTEIDAEANIFASAVRSFTLGFDRPLIGRRTWPTTSADALPRRRRDRRGEDQPQAASAEDEAGDPVGDQRPACPRPRSRS